MMLLRYNLSLARVFTQAYTSDMKRISPSFWRQLLTLVLVSLLGMTNVAMAVGQMNAAASGEMVICVGNGHITVEMDADGQPVKRKTVCPDCVTTVAFTALHTARIPPSSDVFTATIYFAGTSQPAHTIATIAPPARAPPALG